MPSCLIICADCERHVLQHPRRAKVLAEALACLTRLLFEQKRLRGLRIVRESCLKDCPSGRICMVLRCGNQEVRHNLAPGDDLKAVAAKLADTAMG